MTSEIIDREARNIFNLAAISLPPPHAVNDLLSIGVCVRCIFRSFGAHGSVYSCSSLTAPMLLSFLREEKGFHSDSSENGIDFDNDDSYCCVCLGILQLASDSDREMGKCEEKASVGGFVERVGEVIRRENHQIDGFSLEISIPPVIAANERALRLYLKKKYDCEEWFKDKFPSEQITVKDALRLLITSALEKHLDAKSGANEFRIRFMYTHSESSAKLQCLLANGHGCKRRKIEATVGIVVDLNGRTRKDSNAVCSESDAAILRALSSLQDHMFIEQFMLPPQKVSKPCQLTTTCHRMPIYIGGRYLKLSRKVSQSRWIIDDERMGEASVEEIIGDNALAICKGDSYKFHAAGREDIDVRMLGSGRPFLVEVLNARCMPSTVDVQQVADTINNSPERYVTVRNLKVLGSEIWTLMREGEAEKQKQYSALVWTSRPLTEEDLDHISSIENMEILQRTPIRVLHRRSPLERKRIIHWMRVEKIAGSCQYFLLHLCAQAGTYIKEFVHGDLGRTHPSIGFILGCRAEILQLDVTDVKMDFFD
ncbi:uncharacterized protein A4U43_C04F23650 [Asparagus officinalis]|uniref:tRNA pseudouridine(55) synthase n=1 Tax=Asparagus officinalis TaxID=4686 RepID=A0A5P1F386_ASPOF|nr:putative tRNA pseudouridine synthase Pus10 [Asparagus officinalis]ONK72828.1 uncharacterized protein A4U43_C04F23650 [Asparagus officinalis]